MIVLGIRSLQMLRVERRLGEGGGGREGGVGGREGRRETKWEGGREGNKEKIEEGKLQYCIAATERGRESDILQ